MAVLAERHSSVSTSVRRAGWLCLWAGLLGLASGLGLALVRPVVPETQWSYPQSVGAYALTQAWFAVQHLGLLAGILALGRTPALGPRRWARVALAITAASMAALAVTELVAIIPAAEPIDATFPVALQVAYGVLSTVIGAGLVVVGVAVVRERAWTGWHRWVPLALGAWVFVPMSPAMGAGFVWARLGISGWMALFAALGWALVRSADERRT